MSSHPSRRVCAFTLVELLVVIGIIAVLIGVLLPVLSGVQARGRDLKCQSNLRSCVQMILIYATENKGSLPYGWYFNRGDPVTWGDVGGDKRLTTVFSIISRMSSKHYKGDDVFIESGQTVNPDDPRGAHAPFLRCPEAEQVLPHICSYAVQFVAFATPYYEYIACGTAQPFQIRPAKTTELMPFTALIHDTAVHPGMNEDVGYVGNADVDQQRMWTDRLQRRYFVKHDPYSHLPPGLLGQERPVGFPVSPPTHWRNIDPVPTTSVGFAHYPYQGNLRFRHNKNTSMNIGFADGRVESFQAKFQANGAMRSHSVLRKFFQTKWPAGMGIRPNPGEPF